MNALAIIREAVNRDTTSVLHALARTGSYRMPVFEPATHTFNLGTDACDPIEVALISFKATDGDWPAVSATFRGETHPLPELSGPLHHHQRAIRRLGI